MDIPNRWVAVVILLGLLSLTEGYAIHPSCNAMWDTVVSASSGAFERAKLAGNQANVQFKEGYKYDVYFDDMATYLFGPNPDFHTISSMINNSPASVRSEGNNLTQHEPETYKNVHDNDFTTLSNNMGDELTEGDLIYVYCDLKRFYNYDENENLIQHVKNDQSFLIDREMDYAVPTDEVLDCDDPNKLPTGLGVLPVRKNPVHNKPGYTWIATFKYDLATGFTSGRKHQVIQLCPWFLQKLKRYKSLHEVPRTDLDEISKLKASSGRSPVDLLILLDHVMLQLLMHKQSQPMTDDRRYNMSWAGAVARAQNDGENIYQHAPSYAFLSLAAPLKESERTVNKAGEIVRRDRE